MLDRSEEMFQDESASSSSSPPDHPDLSDLGSIADLSSRFTSLTARKMIAGGYEGSITSIDTLIEVNNAALARASLENNI